MNKLILASSSPRRKEILLNNGYKFDIFKSNYDENILNLPYSKELVENCAMNKALDVKNKNTFKNGEIIISADTVVVLDNIILGKPKDKKEALSTLLSLSHKKHFVSTSICLIQDDKILKDSEITFVTFKKINEDEIINYIKLDNPMDKAGSYGIQDKNFNFAKSIEGNIDNVIGFPMTLFKKMISKLN